MPALKPVAWSPSSWRSLPAVQMPDYADKAVLGEVEQKLSTFPPLVFAGEARQLRKALAEVAAGKAFLLQGGDCAESFAEHRADNIRDYFRVFLQMAVVMTYLAASRWSKSAASPVSSPSHDHRQSRDDDGVELPSYKGDNINGPEFTPQARRPDPEPADEAYRQSAATLNLLRAFAIGGYADLERCINGRLDLSKARRRASATRSWPGGFPRRWISCGAAASRRTTVPQLRRTNLYTSHEALLLGYEQAMTRIEFDVRRLVRDIGAHALDRRSHAPA